MSVTDKAQRLFEYISHVYAIDLPVDRDVTKYGAELWWQADNAFDTAVKFVNLIKEIIKKENPQAEFKF